MSVAYLFPGQGSEVPRMGLALAAAHAEAGRLLELASSLTGVDLPGLLRRGGRALERTEIIQPALTAVCLGVVAALRDRGLRPDLVLGHSSGELAAWAASGAVDGDDAVRLSALRGRLMGREAERSPGGMLALSATEDEIRRALAARGLADRVAIAAINAPDEVVVCGSGDALALLRRDLDGTVLAATGAWHGPAMSGASAELLAAARSLTARRPNARIVANADGQIVEDAAAVPSRLAAQLTSPVRFTCALGTLVRSGVSEVVVVGPGRVLRSLVVRNVGPAVRVHMAEAPDDIERIAEALRS